MGKTNVSKTLNAQQNVSLKQKNNLEKNEKTSDIAPSAAKNTKSGNNGKIVENILDENDFYSEEEYSQEEDEYSDESYEFDEAETAQEAFEAKYYHNRKTSSANNKNSYNNKFSLKKVNTLLANQNIMVVDKNQLTETINNSGLLSARVPPTPHTTPVQNTNQTSTGTTSTNVPSNGIDLTVLCSNTSLASSISNSSENLNEKETIQNQKNQDSKVNEVNIDLSKSKKGRKASKKYENSNSFYVTEDNEGFIKSKKSKNKKLNDASSTKINSNNSSNEQLNKLSNQSDNVPTENQPSFPTSKRSSIQISVDKKQIQILCGSKTTPIKISENKNLAIIVNPTSVQESDIQELLVSPTKSRSKNNKPSTPVLSSSPYIRNHNKNNNNKNNNNFSANSNSKPNSPLKLSADTNEITSPTRRNKNKSIIAESPLFVGSYPPLINTKSRGNQMDQNSINYKYNLLNEYNMKKSASPVENSGKNRFLKDESEINNEEQQKLSKKERKALKKLQKNQKFNDEYSAINNTRKTYIVDGGDDEVYRNIFGAKCDTEPEDEEVPTKKSHKKNKNLSKQQSQVSQTNDDDELEISPKKRNNKKSQKDQQEHLDEDIPVISKKKQNRKNSKGNNKNSVTEKNENDDDGNHRKHSKKNKHQELEFNVENINDEDDFFNVTSSIKNKKNKKGARN